MNNALLTPVVVLVTWSMVMWLWMYWERIPAIMKARMRLDPNAPRGEQMNTLPPKVRWKADNYNHLMEQPTIFYAIVFVLFLLGEGTELNRMLAWGYVITRIIHSFVQAVINKIELRFAIFTISSLFLMALILNAIRVIV